MLNKALSTVPANAGRVILARDTYLKDGIRAWTDYQATGMHVTKQEADVWLDQLEAGQDTEPSQLHNVTFK